MTLAVFAILVQFYTCFVTLNGPNSLVATPTGRALAVDVEFDPSFPLSADVIRGEVSVGDLYFLPHPISSLTTSPWTPATALKFPINLDSPDY
jgi:hypothetical protein